MDMVRHDHEISQQVVTVIKVLEGTRYNPGTVRIPQEALAVAMIDFFFEIL